MSRALFFIIIIYRRIKNVGGNIGMRMTAPHRTVPQAKESSYSTRIFDLL
jgi:hypothetical protein